jgi:hypothetical protein
MRRSEWGWERDKKDPVMQSRKFQAEADDMLQKYEIALDPEGVALRDGRCVKLLGKNIGKVIATRAGYKQTLSMHNAMLSSLGKSTFAFSNSTVRSRMDWGVLEYDPER